MINENAKGPAKFLSTSRRKSVLNAYVVNGQWKMNVAIKKTTNNKKYMLLCLYQ
jgi:hypothetical protein